MSGFHGPVVVDVTQPNLAGIAVTVVCDKGDMLSSSEAKLLCQRVATLYENQGAQVTQRTADEVGADFMVGEEPESDAPPPSTDLTVELVSRQLHTANDPITWWLFFMSATVVPAVTEESFAIDVTVRDQEGFVLVQDSLQGRLVRRMGIGAWGTNVLLDRFLREESDRLTGDAAHQDLSEDLYGQLSQLLFNARMQWEVLALQEPAP